MAFQNLIFDIKYYFFTIFYQKFYVLLISLLGLLAQIASLYHIMLILVGFDLITGIIKAYKKGIRITSMCLSRTTTKILTYVTMLTVIFLFSKYLISDNMAFSITQYTMSLVLCSEFYSILENLGEISGNKNIINVKEYFQNFFKKKSEENNINTTV